jgi:hypothetical protein
MTKLHETAVEPNNSKQIQKKAKSLKTFHKTSHPKPPTGFDSNDQQPVMIMHHPGCVDELNLLALALAAAICASSLDGGVDTLWSSVCDGGMATNAAQGTMGLQHARRARDVSMSSALYCGSTHAIIVGISRLCQEEGRTTTSVRRPP